jgi:hypothetical protein
MGWCIYLSISNGALMQVLIGSLCSDNRLPQANAIISFNNKPAADAVPFFDQVFLCMSLFAVPPSSFSLLLYFGLHIAIFWVANFCNETRLDQ